MNISEYYKFLESKKVRIEQSGFEVADESLNAFLFDFQRHIIKRALKAGKYAIFADCGLGKTLMQLEWARHVAEHTQKPVLILCPLAVSGQTVNEGVKFGIHVERLRSDVFGPGVYITNYDQLDTVDASQFAGVVLDESSILKNYEGATKNAVIDAFSHTPFKLACLEVRGNDTPERKEKLLLGFANNEFRVLITKTKIAQYGLNYQNCRNQVFASIDFSFESLYQAIRRSYRFGQKNDVNIYIITTDTMQNVIHAIETKQRQFEQMQRKMAQYSHQSIHQQERKKMTRQFESKQGEMWEARLGDCVQLIQDVPDESIDFSVFSPPFADLYTYSDELEDMGNSRDYEEFLTAFNFLTKQLYRVIRSGRNVAIHCMDMPIQKGKHGFIGLRDFSGLILKSMEDAGFIYHSRVTIWKNPVTEMQRTKALGLLHKQLKKDATMSRVGIPDYVMIFRKDGERENPVSVNIPVDLWQKWASPVWMDIDYGDTLNRNEAREEKDEKHICPLQLPTIERLIGLYTNPGDLVFTPFGGIFSEIYQAVKMGRRGLAFELKKQYFEVGCKNMDSLEQEKKQLDIFSMVAQ